MRITIAGRTFRVRVADRPGTCTNCSEGIKPGQLTVWKWGGNCHAMKCAGGWQPPATASGTSTQAPPKRRPWFYAPITGICETCSEPVDPGQPVHESPGGWIHTRCAT